MEGPFKIWNQCWPNTLDPPAEKVFNFQGTEHTEINKAISCFVNIREVMPSYREVQEIITRCNVHHNLQLQCDVIESMAVDVLTSVINDVQRQQHMDLDARLAAYPRDPATNDPILRKKLEKNCQLRKAKLNKKFGVKEISDDVQADYTDWYDNIISTDKSPISSCRQQQTPPTPSNTGDGSHAQRPARRITPELIMRRYRDNSIEQRTSMNSRGVARPSDVNKSSTGLVKSCNAEKTKCLIKPCILKESVSGENLTTCDSKLHTKALSGETNKSFVKPCIVKVKPCDVKVKPCDVKVKPCNVKVKPWNAMVKPCSVNVRELVKPCSVLIKDFAKPCTVWCSQDAARGCSTQHVQDFARLNSSMCNRDVSRSAPVQTNTPNNKRQQESDQPFLDSEWQELIGPSSGSSCPTTVPSKISNQNQQEYLDQPLLTSVCQELTDPSTPLSFRESPGYLYFTPTTVERKISNKKRRKDFHHTLLPSECRELIIGPSVSPTCLESTRCLSPANTLLTKQRTEFAESHGPCVSPICRDPSPFANTTVKRKTPDTKLPKESDQPSSNNREFNVLSKSPGCIKSSRYSTPNTVISKQHRASEQSLTSSGGPSLSPRCRSFTSGAMQSNTTLSNDRKESDCSCLSTWEPSVSSGYRKSSLSFTPTKSKGLVTLYLFPESKEVESLSILDHGEGLTEKYNPSTPSNEKSSSRHLTLQDSCKETCKKVSPDSRSKLIGSRDSPIVIDGCEPITVQDSRILGQAYYRYLTNDTNSGRALDRQDLQFIEPWQSREPSQPMSSLTNIVKPKPSREYHVDLSSGKVQDGKGDKGNQKPRTNLGGRNSSGSYKLSKAIEIIDLEEEDFVFGEGSEEELLSPKLLPDISSEELEVCRDSEEHQTEPLNLDVINLMSDSDGFAEGSEEDFFRNQICDTSSEELELCGSSEKRSDADPSTGNDVFCEGAGELLNVMQLCETSYKELAAHIVSEKGSEEHQSKIPEADVYSGEVDAYQNSQRKSEHQTKTLDADVIDIPGSNDAFGAGSEDILSDTRFCDTSTEELAQHLKLSLDSAVMDLSGEKKLLAKGLEKILTSDSDFIERIGDKEFLDEGSGELKCQNQLSESSAKELEICRECEKGSKEDLNNTSATDNVYRIGDAKVLDERSKEEILGTNPLSDGHSEMSQEKKLQEEQSECLNKGGEQILRPDQSRPCNTDRTHCCRDSPSVIRHKSLQRSKPAEQKDAQSRPGIFSVLSGEGKLYYEDGELFRLSNLPVMEGQRYSSVIVLDEEDSPPQTNNTQQLNPLPLGRNREVHGKRPIQPQNGGNYVVTEKRPIQPQNGRNHVVTEKRPMQPKNSGNSEVHEKRPIQPKNSGNSEVHEKRPIQPQNDGNREVHEKRPMQPKNSGNSEVNEKQPIQPQNGGNNVVNEKRPIQPQNDGNSEVHEKRPIQPQNSGNSEVHEKRPILSQNNRDSKVHEKTTIQHKNSENSKVHENRPTQPQNSGNIEVHEKRTIQPQNSGNSEVHDKLPIHPKNSSNSRFHEKKPIQPHNSEVHEKQPIHSLNSGHNVVNEKRPIQPKNSGNSKVCEKPPIQPKNSRNSEVHDNLSVQPKNSSNSKFHEKEPIQPQNSEKPEVHDKQPIQSQNSEVHEKEPIHPQNTEKPKHSGNREVRNKQPIQSQNSEVQGKRPIQSLNSGNNGVDEKPPIQPKNSGNHEERPIQFLNSGNSVFSEKRPIQPKNSENSKVREKPPIQFLNSGNSVFSEERPIQPKNSENNKVCEKPPIQSKNSGNSKVDEKPPIQPKNSGNSKVDEKPPIQPKNSGNIEVHDKLSIQPKNSCINRFHEKEPIQPQNSGSREVHDKQPIPPKNNENREVHEKRPTEPQKSGNHEVYEKRPILPKNSGNNAVHENAEKECQDRYSSETHEEVPVQPQDSLGTMVASHHHSVMAALSQIMRKPIDSSPQSLRRCHNVAPVMRNDSLARVTGEPLQVSIPNSLTNQGGSQVGIKCQNIQPKKHKEILQTNQAATLSSEPIEQRETTEEKDNKRLNTSESEGMEMSFESGDDIDPLSSEPLVIDENYAAATTEHSNTEGKEISDQSNQKMPEPSDKAVDLRMETAKKVSPKTNDENVPQTIQAPMTSDQENVTTPSKDEGELCKPCIADKQISSSDWMVLDLSQKIAKTDSRPTDPPVDLANTAAREKDEGVQSRNLTHIPRGDVHSTKKACHLEMATSRKDQPVLEKERSIIEMGKHLNSNPITGVDLQYADMKESYQLSPTITKKVPAVPKGKYIAFEKTKLLKSIPIPVVEMQSPKMQTVGIQSTSRPPAGAVRRNIVPEEDSFLSEKRKQLLTQTVDRTNICQQQSRAASKKDTSGDDAVVESSMDDSERVQCRAQAPRAISGQDPTASGKETPGVETNKLLVSSQITRDTSATESHTQKESSEPPRQIPRTPTPGSWMSLNMQIAGMENSCLIPKAISGKDLTLLGEMAVFDLIKRKQSNPVSIAAEQNSIVSPWIHPTISAEDHLPLEKTVGKPQHTSSTAIVEKLMCLVTPYTDSIVYSCGGKPIRVIQECTADGPQVKSLSTEMQEFHEQRYILVRKKSEIDHVSKSTLLNKGQDRVLDYSNGLKTNRKDFISSKQGCVLQEKSGGLPQPTREPCSDNLREPLSFRKTAYIVGQIAPKLPSIVHHCIVPVRERVIQSSVEIAPPHKMMSQEGTDKQKKTQIEAERGRRITVQELMGKENATVTFSKLSTMTAPHDGPDRGREVTRKESEEENAMIVIPKQTTETAPVMALRKQGGITKTAAPCIISVLPVQPPTQCAVLQPRPQRVQDDNTQQEMPHAEAYTTKVSTSLQFVTCSRMQKIPLVENCIAHTSISTAQESVCPFSFTTDNRQVDPEPQQMPKVQRRDVHTTADCITKDDKNSNSSQKSDGQGITANRDPSLSKLQTNIKQGMSQLESTSTEGSKQSTVSHTQASVGPAGITAVDSQNRYPQTPKPQSMPLGETQGYSTEGSELSNVDQTPAPVSPARCGADNSGIESDHQVTKLPRMPHLSEACTSEGSKLVSISPARSSGGQQNGTEPQMPKLQRKPQAATSSTDGSTRSSLGKPQAAVRPAKMPAANIQNGKPQMPKLQRKPGAETCATEIGKHSTQTQASLTPTRFPKNRQDNPEPEMPNLRKPVAKHLNSGPSRALFSPIRFPGPKRQHECDPQEDLRSKLQTSVKQRISAGDASITQVTTNSSQTQVSASNRILAYQDLLMSKLQMNKQRISQTEMSPTEVSKNCTTSQTGELRSKPQRLSGGDSSTTKVSTDASQTLNPHTPKLPGILSVEAPTSGYPTSTHSSSSLLQSSAGPVRNSANRDSPLSKLQFNIQLRMLEREHSTPEVTKGSNISPPKVLVSPVRNSARRDLSLAKLQTTTKQRMSEGDVCSSDDRRWSGINLPQASVCPVRIPAGGSRPESGSLLIPPWAKKKFETEVCKTRVRKHSDAQQTLVRIPVDHCRIESDPQMSQVEDSTEEVVKDVSQPQVSVGLGWFLGDDPILLKQRRMSLAESSTSGAGKYFSVNQSQPSLSQARIPSNRDPRLLKQQRMLQAESCTSEAGKYLSIRQPQTPIYPARFAEDTCGILRDPPDLKMLRSSMGESLEGHGRVRMCPSIRRPQASVSPLRMPSGVPRRESGSQPMPPWAKSKPETDVCTTQVRKHSDVSQPQVPVGAAGIAANHDPRLAKLQKLSHQEKVSTTDGVKRPSIIATQVSVAAGRIPNSRDPRLTKLAVNKQQFMSHGEVPANDDQFESGSSQPKSKRLEQGVKRHLAFDPPDFSRNYAMKCVRWGNVEYWNASDETGNVVRSSAQNFGKSQSQEFFDQQSSVQPVDQYRTTAGEFSCQTSHSQLTTQNEPPSGGLPTGDGEWWWGGPGDPPASEAMQGSDSLPFGTCPHQINHQQHQARSHCTYPQVAGSIAAPDPGCISQVKPTRDLMWQGKSRHEKDPFIKEYMRYIVQGRTNERHQYSAAGRQHPPAGDLQLATSCTDTKTNRSEVPTHQPYLQSEVPAHQPYLQSEVPTHQPYPQSEVPAHQPYPQSEVPAHQPYLQSEVPAHISYPQTPAKNQHQAVGVTQQRASYTETVTHMNTLYRPVHMIPRRGSLSQVDVSGVQQGRRPEHRSYTVHHVPTTHPKHRARRRTHSSYPSGEKSA